MSDDRSPTYSTRLWSEEVGMADPGADFNRPPVLAYTFGNRTLISDVNTTLYAPRPLEELIAAVATSQGQTSTAALSAMLQASATGQAQSSAAIGSVVSPPLDLTVMAAQVQSAYAETVTATVGSVSYVIGSTAQVQQASASAGVAAAVSVATSQAQHNTALTPISSGVRTLQAQGNAGRANILAPLDTVVTTSQAQLAGTIPVDADTPAYATVWNATDNSNRVEAGRIYFDKPIQDWNFQDAEYAEQMGTIKVTQSTMKVTYGPHDFGAMRLSGTTYSAIDGKTKHTVIVNFKPTEDNWPNYPRQTGAARGGYRRGTRVINGATVNVGLSDTFMWPFVVTVHRADGSILGTMDMPRDHLPINSPELSEVPTLTKPMRLHMHCASMLVWESHDSKQNAYAHKYMPGVDERALRPHVAKTRVAFNPMSVAYTFTQENSMHHWYGMAKWSLPCSQEAWTADKAVRTDPYLWGIGPNDPNGAYNPWGTQPWATQFFGVPASDYGHLDGGLVLLTGWAYEPGSYSGKDYHRGPGGIRMDRVVIDSPYAIHMSNPNWVHLRDNTPISEMVKHWSMAEFNMAFHHFDGDIRDFASIPVAEHLAAKWCHGEVYYNVQVKTFTDLDHAIPQFCVENSPTSHADRPHWGAMVDQNNRMPWNGHSVDWLHNYGGSFWAATLYLSPAHVVSSKFRWLASGMCQAGHVNPNTWWRSFLVRDWAWNMRNEAMMWKLGSDHPQGVRQQDIEARMEIALNALHDNVYVPLEVNNSQTMYFRCLRNFGIPVVYDNGMWKMASWTLGYYLADTLRVWRQNGFWHRMFTRSDKCQKVLLMMLKLLDRGCFGYYLDADGCFSTGNSPNLWIGDRSVNSDSVEIATSWADWNARIYHKAPGENMITNADGTRRYCEQGEFLRMQWPYIRRDYFPEYPAERDVNAVCAKVDQWVIDFHAAIEILYGQPGTERTQSGREWSIHPGCARILPPPVLGP
jgi:hypothetical protein